MKNYIELGKKMGLRLDYDFCKTDRLMKKYKFNRCNPYDESYFEVTYMNGFSEFIPVMEITKEKLDEEQKKSFDRIYSSVERGIRDITNESLIAGLNLTNSILQFSIGNELAGTCWLFSSVIWLPIIYQPLKLKHEMNLVKWIIDNKDEVDKVINQEKEKIRKQEQPVEVDMDQNIPVVKYDESKLNDKELLPYSEEIYRDGVDLNNVDSLTVGQMHKIKRKTLSNRKNRR